MLLLTDGHTDVHRAEQREDESLDERHQKLHQTHEDVKENGNRRHGPTDGRVHLTEDENQRDKRQRDDVAGGDVGEESHHQHERLREDTDSLHQRHDRQRNLQPPRHARRVEDVLPVLLAGGEGGHEEGDERQNAGHGNVAREVRAARENRDDAHDVVQEDEEEEREQIGRIFVGVFAQRRGNHLVLKEHDDGFHEGLQTARGLVGMFSVAFRHAEENARDQNQGDEQSADVLGDGDVPLANVAGIFRPFFKMAGVFAIEVALQFHDFPFVVAPPHRVTVVSGLAVVQLVGKENDGMTLVEQDDGQRDGDALVAVAADVPAVAVNDVLNDERTGIKRLFLHRLHIIRCRRLGCLGERFLACKEHHQRAKKHCQRSLKTLITHTFIISYTTFQNLILLNLKSRAIYDFLVSRTIKKIPAENLSGFWESVVTLCATFLLPDDFLHRHNFSVRHGLHKIET